jgi:hypothetical protein
MAAQKVGFTPRLLRQVALTGPFQAQLHWNLHSRAELETCKLGEPYPRSMPKPYHFWPQVTPSAKISIKGHKDWQTFNSSQTSFLGFVKMRESLQTRTFDWTPNWTTLIQATSSGIHVHCIFNTCGLHAYSHSQNFLFSLTLLHNSFKAFNAVLHLIFFTGISTHACHGSCRGS